ncbi:MAG: transcription antitermination factor NusB [Gammaproteobacteria bacterium]
MTTLSAAGGKISNHARRRARRCAVQALYQWQLGGNALGEIEAQFRAEPDNQKADFDYFHELLHQVPAHIEELDAHLTPYLDRPVPEVDPVECAILRLCSYELAYRPDVPYRVVINEGIDLAKRYGADQGHKYINGVLDRLARVLRPVEQGG